MKGENKSGPIDKDGFEGGPSDVTQFLIEVGLNGFFITITYDDPEVADERYIAETMDEVTELLKAKF